MEYAKSGPEDLLIRISAVNRGPEAAALHLLPTLWFRNTWSWRGGGPKPELRQAQSVDGASVIAVHHTDPLFQESLSDYFMFCERRSAGSVHWKRDQQRTAFRRPERFAVRQGWHQQLHRQQGVIRKLFTSARIAVLPWCIPPSNGWFVSQKCN